MHEKPFAGVNGSGKHLNWSMSDDQGNNLLNPGDTPHDNIQFLVFCAAVLRAVNKYQGLLRMSIASAGNDHRLGANEAPPAIISVFLGDQLTDIFEQIEKGGAKSTKQGGILDTGVSSLPKLPRDAGDRNRTSPFAFTGNKFEFRAVVVGPEHRVPEHRAEPGRDRVARLHRDAARGGDHGQGRKKIDDAVRELLPKLIKENKRIIFNGNGYSEEWRKEAAKRGLLNLTQHRRCAARADEGRRHQDVREVQGAQRARAQRPLRDQPRDLRQDDQRRRRRSWCCSPIGTSCRRRSSSRRTWRSSVTAVKDAGGSVREVEEAARQGERVWSTRCARKTDKLAQGARRARRRRPRSTPSTCATRSCRR